jgi:hypothetical protein
MTESAIRIVGQNLPGRSCCRHANVHLGVQRNRDVIDLVPADVTAVVFTVPVSVVRDPALGLDFRGPHIHGPRGRRFIYLSWGNIDTGDAFEMFRRAKLNFTTMPEHILHALAAGSHVQATLNLTGRDGGPLCASIPDTAITWTIDDTAATS